MPLFSQTWAQSHPDMNSQLRENKNENSLHSILLILSMAAILSLIGWLLFGLPGLIGAAVFAFGSAIFGPRMSSKLVLRMYQARPITREVSPTLTQLFNELCRRAELEHRPGLYYIPSRVPNAFATGVGRSSAVAITDGLIRMLNTRELTGVIAHEVAHLRHCDTRVMGLADAIGKLTSAISRIGLVMFIFSGAGVLLSGSGWRIALTGLLMMVAPTLIALLQLALSRSREFNADMGAAELTGDPMGLASALKKLDPEQRSGNIFGQVLDPSQRKQPAFLRTHPPTEERVRELTEVATANEQTQDAVRKSFEDRKATNRKGEPVIYIGYPRVNQQQRYRMTTDTYH